MSSLRHRAQQRWAATGLAARVWWTASLPVQPAWAPPADTRIPVH
jgi:hypothetical protein